MFDTTQETVDRLASALERTVVLLDSDFMLVANSRHFDELDAAEMELLAQRRPSSDLIATVRAERGYRQRAAFTVSADAPGILVPRIFVPLKSQMQFLGLLVVASHDPLTPEQAEVVSEAVEVFRHLMERATQSIDEANASIEAEMLGLLTDDDATRQASARELNSLGMYNRSRYFVAMCLRVRDEWSPWGGPPSRDVLTRLLLRAITTPMIDAYTFVPTVPDSFILIGFANQPRSEALRSMVERIEHELETARDGEELDAIVGVGGIVDDLAVAWQSFDQAMVAAEVASSRGERSSQWDENATATSLATILAPPVPPHLRTKPLRRLSTASPDVVQLLEQYFEAAGNVAQVAERLHVHRATIYQRLARASRDLALDLENGDDRLIVQAWLARRRFH